MRKQRTEYSSSLDALVAIIKRLRVNYNSLLYKSVRLP